MRTVREQLIQVQELTGQSQRRLQELRASLESQQMSPVPTPPPGGAAAPTPGGDSAGAPGPNQLYELSLDQFRRGSYGAAREGFGELLARYPTADVAADAQFFLAEAFAAERNAAAADSGYAAVVSRFPSSPRASTALYKRARQRQAAGRTAEARAMFEDVIRRYPRSGEAELARDAMREGARRPR
jgi:tol-pal system protein YbgF